MELIGAVDLGLKGLELMDWPWWHYGDEHTFPFQHLFFSNVQARFPLLYVEKVAKEPKGPAPSLVPS